MNNPRKAVALSLRMLLLSSLLLQQGFVFAQGTAGRTPVLRPVIAETLVPVETLAPVASDGFVGEAYLRKPPGAGPFPAVVLVHGGAPRWPTTTLRDFIVHTHASRFLAAGYAVVAITRRDLDLALPFAAEQPAVRDAVAVVDHLRTLPFVDDDNIVVRGTSVGGYLTLEVAAAREVAAIVVEEPFAFPFVGITVNGPEGQEPQDSKIAQLQEPILDIEGDQTPNINEFNREVFLPMLMEAGKQLRVSQYPGGLHSFAFYDNAERTPDPSLSLEAFGEIDRFFREHLDLLPQPLDAALVSYEEVVY